MEVKRLEFEDFQLEYFRFGTGNKVMVMLPGLSIKSVMLSASAVEKEYSMFSKEFTVYLFERRLNPTNNTTIKSLADDTIKAIKKLGLKDIYLIGVSQGGMLAMEIALAEPQLIKKMVLGSTSAKIENNIVLDRWIDLAQKKEKEALYLDFAKCIYPEGMYKHYERAFKMIAKTVEDKELDRFVKIANATRSYYILDKVKDIKCPTLVIGAKDDEVLFGYASEDIAKEMNCELYMYEPGFAHAVFDTAPDYKQRVLEFFNK